MELDLQSLFDSCVQLYSLTEIPQLPPHFGSYTKALLVSQDGRHFIVISWYQRIGPQKPNYAEMFFTIEKSLSIEIRSTV